MIKYETKNRPDLRQALFEFLVPAKEQGEERIELAPPQSWRKWVNAARVWSRKLEVGLTIMELEAFVRETDGVYEVLAEARQKLAKDCPTQMVIELLAIYLPHKSIENLGTWAAESRKGGNA